MSDQPTQTGPSCARGQTDVLTSSQHGDSRAAVVTMHASLDRVHSSTPARSGGLFTWRCLITTQRQIHSQHRVNPGSSGSGDETNRAVSTVTVRQCQCRLPQLTGPLHQRFRTADPISHRIAGSDMKMSEVFAHLNYRTLIAASSLDSGSAIGRCSRPRTTSRKHSLCRTRSSASRQLTPPSPRSITPRRRAEAA